MKDERIDDIIHTASEYLSKEECTKFYEQINLFRQMVRLKNENRELKKQIKNSVGYHLTDKQKYELSMQGYSYQIPDYKQDECCDIMKNADDDAKERFTEFLDKLAEQDKEKNEQRDLETKLLIGKFIGTCKEYFFDVHIHRNILPTDYKKVNHTVQDLLEVYEEYLPYIMRNPDHKFGLIYLVIMPTRQLDINIRIKDILNITINPYQTEINRINDFLECITTSWRDFKKEHQANEDR